MVCFLLAFLAASEFLLKSGRLWRTVETGVNTFTPGSAMSYRRGLQSV